MLENFERAVIFYSLSLIMSAVGRILYHETGDSDAMFVIFYFVCLIIMMWHTMLFAGEWADKYVKKKE